MILKKQNEILKTKLKEENEKEIEKEPITITDKKIEERLNKHLANGKTSNLLKAFNLKIPYEYKKEDKEEFLKDFEKGLKIKEALSKRIKNFTKEKAGSRLGITKAVYNPPKKGSKPTEKTKILLMIIIIYQFMLLICVK